MNKISLSPNMQGALWGLLSAVSFVFMSVLLHILGDKVSLSMMIFWRSLAGLLVILPMAFGNKDAWVVKRPIPVLMRSLFTTIALFSSFYAFAHLPIAHAQAISFSRALFITVLAFFVLHEKVAWRRITATIVGFVGVLIMTRPSAQMDFASLVAILSAFTFALSIITIKELTKDHSPLSLVLWVNIFTTLAGLPFIAFDPVIPTLPQMGLLLLMGLFGTGSQLFYVRGLNVGDVTLLSIMDYVRLPLSVLLGYLFFKEVPDKYSVIGAVIVIGSTLYITLREAQLGKTKAQL